MKNQEPNLHGPIWSKRLSRTLQLRSLIPHSREILDFYGNLLSIQSDIARIFSATNYSDSLLTEEKELPHLQVSHFDIKNLTSIFDHLLQEILEIGPAMMTESATTLLDKPNSFRTELLGTALQTNFSDKMDFSLFLRGFFEPIYVTLSDSHQCQQPEETTNRCFFCNSKPIISLLRDLPEYQGARHLLCSMCSTEWRFPRLTCINCGENDSKNLELHISDSLDYLRIEECKSCNCYIKNLDLRKSAESVPIVDEIASLELDLWANRQGLRKTWPNLLQL